VRVQTFDLDLPRQLLSDLVFFIACYS